jgi:hypothetical protein
MVGPQQRGLPQAGGPLLFVQSSTVDVWFDGIYFLGFCSVSDDASWACWDLHNVACLKQVGQLSCAHSSRLCTVAA